MSSPADNTSRQQRDRLVGRAATVSPANRFERIQQVPFFEDWNQQLAEDAPRKLETQFYEGATRKLIQENTSPDISFRYSVNPYRGCEHGCAYCYARPGHETLGMNAGIDFETKVLVKRDAPRLLRDELNDAKWTGESICLSGVTDCYQPAEAHFRVTRALIEVMNEAHQAFAIITKNALVTRDLDLLPAAAAEQRVKVFISLTTLDAGLSRRMEPRTSAPPAKLRAIRELSQAGVPVGVMMAPIIPGLNEIEIPKLLAEVKQAGACAATFTLLRLPMAVEPIFMAWLNDNVPDKAEKVAARLRDCRGGRLHDGRFGHRMRGDGKYAEQIRGMFDTFAKKYELQRDLPPQRTDYFRPPRAANGQGRLF